MDADGNVGNQVWLPGSHGIRIPRHSLRNVSWRIITSAQAFDDRRAVLCVERKSLFLGDFNNGVMVGKSMLDFVPLNETGLRGARL